SGLRRRSITAYYDSTLRNVLSSIGKDVLQITTDDLRLYLDSYQSNRAAGKTTIGNIRRILSSFFAWLEDEDFFVSFHPLSSFLPCTIICWAGVRIRLLHFPVEGIEKQALRDHDRSIGSTCFFFVLYFLKCRATTSFPK
ncbi:MAG: phage integrase N-terminal SAM-like domain-containing protein, partial [Firmicutes bacterium]|nr:phage integrase N-terminal SAM-like domain-containing protein [Bacillota bacterium]